MAAEAVEGTLAAVVAVVEVVREVVAVAEEGIKLAEAEEDSNKCPFVEARLVAAAAAAVEGVEEEERVVVPVKEVQPVESICKSGTCFGARTCTDPLQCRREDSSTRPQDHRCRRRIGEANS